MSCTLHRGAALDLAEAASFYRREGGRALAARFLDEFERITELLMQRPGIGTVTNGERRWYPFSGFPYSVIYRPVAGGIRVLVLRHQNRDPAYGELRR